MNKGLVAGRAEGEVLVLDDPLSLWGGADPTTGMIIEPSHPQFGESLSGRVVIMPHGRGSSSASSVLAELLRLGLGPAAVVLREPDSILAIGSLVAGKLYGSVCPMAVSEEVFEDGVTVVVDGETGLVTRAL